MKDTKYRFFLGMFVGFILAGAFFFFFRGPSAQPRPTTPPPDRAAAPGTYLPVIYRINPGARPQIKAIPERSYLNAVNSDPNVNPDTDPSIAPLPKVYDSAPQYAYSAPPDNTPERPGDDPPLSYSIPTTVYSILGHAYPGNEPRV